MHDDSPQMGGSEREHTREGRGGWGKRDSAAARVLPWWRHESTPRNPSNIRYCTPCYCGTVPPYIRRPRGDIAGQGKRRRPPVLQLRGKSVKGFSRPLHIDTACK